MFVYMPFPIWLHLWVTGTSYLVLIMLYSALGGRREWEWFDDNNVLMSFHKHKTDLDFHKKTFLAISKSVTLFLQISSQLKLKHWRDQLRSLYSILHWIKVLSHKSMWYAVTNTVLMGLWSDGRKTYKVYMMRMLGKDVFGLLTPCFSAINLKKYNTEYFIDSTGHLIFWTKLTLLDHHCALNVS